MISHSRQQPAQAVLTRRETGIDSQGGAISLDCLLRLFELLVSAGECEPGCGPRGTLAHHLQALLSRFTELAGRNKCDGEIVPCFQVIRFDSQRPLENLYSAWRLPLLLQL